MLSPYYQDELVTLFHGDSEDCFCEIPHYDIVVTDPPYGIKHPTDFHKRGRGRLAECANYPTVHGDTRPFNPQTWIDRPCCLWGANYFADKLPISSGWLVWDKERPDDLDQATCELAWTNFVKGVRRFRFLWNGFMRASKEPLVHPTQKPIALFRWILSLRYTPAGIMLDPYVGSGASLLAAKQMGRRAIGVEIHEPYCEAAAKALEQETPSLFVATTSHTQHETCSLFDLSCEV